MTNVDMGIIAGVVIWAVYVIREKHLEMTRRQKEYDAEWKTRIEKARGEV